jgi:predicted methyltransferase
MLETSPELYGKVQTVVVDGKAPKLGMDGKLDEALVIRGLHGMVNNGSLDAWLTEIHTALKPKGVLGIEQHRAKEGSDAKESSKKGYLPEKWVIETIEAKGFKLAAKSEINANPKDTKDYPEGVWALPPTFERGDKDKAALTAIGESDRMTLRFVKVEPPKTK